MTQHRNQQPPLEVLSEFGNPNDTYPPFSESTIQWLDSLSRTLRREMARQPDVLAFSRWIGKPNLDRLSTEFRSIEAHERSLRLPIGRVLQIASSNVEMLFAYVWALNVLIGNPSKTRISSRASHLTREVIEVIQKNRPIDHPLAYWNIFTCDRDSEVLRQFEEESNAIVIWGGNQTVEHFSKTAGTQSKVIGFPDRTSAAIVSLEWYASLSASARQDFWDRLARDTLTFGQQACSSPSSLVWVGDAAANQEVPPDAPALRHHFAFSDSEVSKRRDTLFRLAAEGQLIEPFDQDKFKAPWYLASVIPEAVEVPFASSESCGLLKVAKASDFQSAISMLPRNCQTVVYEGFDRASLRGYVSSLNQLGQPLRYVRVGQGLNFDNIWDGKNLLLELSKPISI